MSNDEIVGTDAAQAGADRARPDASQTRRRGARAVREPVAIVGIGCRFPGGADMTRRRSGSCWSTGVDAVTEVPADRWDIDALYDPDPDAPGKMSSRCGGFLDDVSGFDPQFFGISPREAASMDPQQRLLLEVAWEALEHAGIAPDGPRRHAAPGVFVGMTTSDYAQVQVARHRPRPGSTRTTPRASPTASPRGGCPTCSGCRARASRSTPPAPRRWSRCTWPCRACAPASAGLALAGGVNLILSPENSIMLSKLRMMAPDGRCKAFDAAADGFVRGEGCGLVVLEAPERRRRRRRPGAGRDPRLGGQPGRRQQRPHGAERSGPGDGDPRRAGQRRRRRCRGRLRRGPRHRHRSGRPDRGPGPRRRPGCGARPGPARSPSAR